jgi:hypothetical protein
MRLPSYFILLSFSPIFAASAIRSGRLALSIRPEGFLRD